MKRVSVALAWALVFLSSLTLRAQDGALSVVSSGPQGETTTREQTNEIRIVFSEPMVTLGKVPEKVVAPFVKFTPAIAGNFRWSGTTTLIFMPAAPLPFATAYEVTVDTSATAVSGRKLAKPVTFRFSTPAVRVEDVRWMRRGGTVDGRIVLLLTFNQPVRSADIAAALSARLEPHPWKAPAFTPEQASVLKAADPSSVERFEAKVKETQLAAASKAPVKLQPTTDWNKKAFPPSPRMVAFEVVSDVVPEAWLRLSIARTVRSPAGPVTPRAGQNHIVETEKAFFVTGFDCHDACDSERRNALRFTTKVDVKAFAAAVSVIDAATGKPLARQEPKKKPEEERFDDFENQLTLEDAGYTTQPPNRKYIVTARPTLRAADGQTLGYTWVGSIDNWHRFAFTSFGDGQGVWEKDGGSTLPFYARNLQDVTQWIAPIQPADLMNAVRRAREGNVQPQLFGPGTSRKLGVTPDRIQSHGLDVSPALSGGTGVVWAAVREGTPIERSKTLGRDGRKITRASVVQVTNLGITVKDSPQNTLVFVTRLDNGAPVSGARVSIVRTDNSTHWRGTTGSDGLVVAPSTPLRNPENYWDFSFIVVAEKDGDVAYVGSDWNEGISPWMFGTGYNIGESTPLLRGSIFTDRGVYRLGEQVQFKAILRHNAPDGVRLLPAGTPVLIAVRDAQNRIVDERTIRVGNWSSAEWTWTLPTDGVLGDYSLRAILESEKPKPQPAARQRQQTETPEWDEDYRAYQKTVRASFLVAAYRRPDFRVDVTLSPAGNPIAGEQLKGSVNARYLFGTPMAARPVSWKFDVWQGGAVPAAITEKYSDDRWAFVAWDEEQNRETVSAEAGKLTADGRLQLDLPTRSAGVPMIYQLEGDVEDVSRQHIANRATLVVHPAPWYVGIKRPGYFVDQKNGLATEIVSIGLDGKPVAGIPVDVELVQIQWKSVREAIGDGFYEWRTEREEISSGKWNVTTAEEPVPLNVTFKNGGYFELRATGRGADGKYAQSESGFYVIGTGYTAWRRFDHQRIELVPEKQTWKPGETARVMIQSPWEQATALVTTEREGIRSQQQFALTSTMQTVSVPITEADIPNLFVSVVLIKGRTSATAGETAQVPDEKTSEDPGKPTFRIGYVELKVEDRSKRLTLDVTANREEYRPASAANVRLEVKDQQGRGTASEVTLWAVDYGVLSLTGYRTPDVLESVYVRKALQVMNSDNRQRIISRRVLTPKGDTEGGGGGSDPGAGTLRKDFRVLAFWLGSVTTGADGRASVDVKLPESLTTYRIMAVAADRSSRFGSGSAEIRTNKPLTLKPTFPRFLAVGDRAFFGAVVGSQLKSGGTATVTMRSFDPSILEITGATQQQVTIAPGGTTEVRFQASGKAIGRARLQMTARLADESDAFEDVIPVEVQLSPETVAAYGETSSAVASETLALPTNAVPGFGGLTLEMSSTALVGLGEGARYLVEYPFGCAEQRSSRAQALMLAADLGDTFALAGMNTAQMRASAQQTLRELERFQCSDGAFAFWPGACNTASPYLTAYLLQVMKTGADLKYQVNSLTRDRASRYLEQQLATPEPANADWRQSYLAWQAFAVKVLAEGGRNQDSHINRLYAVRQRIPVFAVAFLHDALTAKGESGARVTELRRMMQNAILPEAGYARVEDFTDSHLLWFWHSNTRSTAIVLNSFVKAGVAEAPIRQLVRGLMTAREGGRWGNTQENAYAMEALVNYYRRYEPETPNFRAVAKLGQQELASGEFRQRSTEATTKQIPLNQVPAKATAQAPLTFTREGTGTLFYTARLRYAIDQAFPQGMDSGFQVERTYRPYRESGPDLAAATTYQAGDLVRITLTFRVSKERRFVAVTDPLPAGFEAVESWFNTTTDTLAASEQQEGRRSSGMEWAWWMNGGFDHAERHDDRVQLFATRLSEGTHVYSYVARATTSGTFRTAPARAEEMYTPEIFGRTSSTVIEVKR